MQFTRSLSLRRTFQTVGMLTLALSGCGDSSNSAQPDAATGDASVGGHTVTIAFSERVAGVPVVFGTDYPYTTAAGNKFNVSRVSFFISNLTLTTTGGATFAVPGAHYVDHDTQTTWTVPIQIGGTTEPLASVSFVMGLPPALNVTGAFPTQPESLMEWPAAMGGGYHHMKFEGRYLDRSDAPFNIKVHAGGLGGVDYSFPVTLNANNVALGRDLTLGVAMNLEQWFTNPHDWDLNDYFNTATPGIMGNATAQAELRDNGATVFTLVVP